MCCVCVCVYLEHFYFTITSPLPFLTLPLTTILQMGLNIDPAALLPGATHPNRAQEEKAVSFNVPVTTHTLYNPNKVSTHIPVIHPYIDLSKVK